ncbi:MAG: DUF3560 domain-containing protein, partial [Ktedonobacterales bacterium]|nr:DUF3560 domain-containing protein [Ktedonobacterales bacterium]
MRGAVVPAGVIVTDGGTCEYAAERPDRLAAATERHAGEANQLWERSDKMAEAIPLGQPILVGHYSEHRDRNYRKRIQNMTIKSIEESRTAQDLADKARSSAYAQKKRMDPGVIARRIQKLQADVVSTTNHLTHVIQFEGWYLVKGTEEQKAASLKKINDTKAWSAAKIAELEADIAREQATLASVGGLPFDSLDLHVGDFFAAWPGLCEITRINKKTVSVHAHNRYNERRTLDITKIKPGHIIARASEGLTMEEIHTRYGAYTMNTTYRHRTTETLTPEEAEQARRETQVKLQQEIATREEQVMREKG